MSQFPLIAFAIIFSGCCDRPGTRPLLESPESLVAVSYTVDIPDQELSAMLWQKSYPEEYQKLVALSQSPENPFSSPIETPLDQLTPADFGISGWGRGIVPRTFDELGYPLNKTKGASASWDSETSLFQVIHLSEAIKAFESRFPEFTMENRHQ